VSQVSGHSAREILPMTGGAFSIWWKRRVTFARIAERYLSPCWRLV